MEANQTSTEMNEKQTDKELFISLLRSTEREGVDELIEFLLNSDFFTAPASALYHKDVEGGLCAHSLNVYENLDKLAKLYCPDMPHDTIVIVSLLHDLAKVDFYEKYTKNEKVYCENGDKSDAGGRYSWVSSEKYRVKQPSDREYMWGEHGLNSYMIAKDFIKMSNGEATAIINHHMNLDNGKPRDDISEIYNRYPTASLLHLADLAATYINENPYMVIDDEQVDQGSAE